MKPSKCIIQSSKSLLFAILMSCTLLFSSCNEDQDNGLPAQAKHSNELVPLQITTDLQNIIELRPKSALTRAAFEGGPNDQIGIFVTAQDGDLNNPYDGLSTCNNILTTYTGGNWVLSTNVYLSRNWGKVFAYYPYSSSNTDGHHIPIEHNTQTDYLFGIGNRMVNNTSNEANINLMHALSLLQFRFKKDASYNGECKVEAIGICNKNGLAAERCILFNSGWLNIESGEITFDKTKTEGLEIRNIENGVLPSPVTTEFPTDENQYAKLMILAPKDAPQNLGDLLITFQIDGRKYEHPVPTNQLYIIGTKYTYDVTVSPTKMHFSKVTIRDWTGGQSSQIAL